MDSIKSHKIKLYPTKGQEVYFNKVCGDGKIHDESQVVVSEAGISLNVKQFKT